MNKKQQTYGSEIEKRLDTTRFDTEWFVEQFGKRPKRSLFDISEDIRNSRRKLACLEQELFDAEIYMAKETAALKSYVNTVYQLKKRVGILHLMKNDANKEGRIQ